MKDEIGPDEKEVILCVLKHITEELEKPPIHEGYAKPIASTIFMLYALIETVMDWDEWCRKIPSIRFDPEWKVKIIPPYAGAMCRFLVEKEDVDETVSVYLDCHSILGWMNAPYWEVYPVKGDTDRIPMDDTEELLDTIRNAFKFIEKKVDDLQV